MDLFKAMFSSNPPKSETKQVKKKQKIIKRKTKINSHKSDKKRKQKQNVKPTKKLTKKRKYFDPKKIFKEGWLMISSKAFRNLDRYPHLRVPEENRLHKILVNELNFRVNDRFKYGSSLIPDKLYFWFHLSGRMLYYSNKKVDINILDTLYIKNIKTVLSLSSYSSNANCFKITDTRSETYKLCARTLIEKIKWVCKIQEILGVPLEEACGGKKKRNIDDDEENENEPNKNIEKMVIQKVNQPLIIIPQPSHNCNEKWDYSHFGSDWECECAEGKEQSPIDLPKPEQAILSAVKPHFDYIEFGSVKGNILSDISLSKPLKIKYSYESLRIKYNNMGKVVTLDGVVYIAEEIVFHTPSEHTINGERFDMEMQVIHKGKTKGDIAKKVVFSVLFKQKPGVYNKFLEKIDVFNLPNQNDKYREIRENLFIPYVFEESNYEDILTMFPFSFYTYQGSISYPPCSQQTIMYVASDPAPIGVTALTMFREAIKKRDIEGELEINRLGGEVSNYRETQPLYGRAIFFYDHLKFCGPNDLFKGSLKRPNEGKPKSKNVGHYEKHELLTKRYFYVDSDKPSGLPGSLVVSSKEANENLNPY